MIPFTRTIITLRTLLETLLTSLFSLLPTMPSPSDPSEPLSYPIKALRDLESRSYFASFHFPFNRSTVRLEAEKTELPRRRRVLVCHDMEGGYGDDKWVQGGRNRDAYALWHWYLMDVFVYFSHGLVTLPPPCWTNTAHKHGLKVLGTFIAEWDEGRTMANKLLLTEESSKMYAERLTELATALGFDGWLINMEVKLDVTQIPNLKLFVSHLTETMHSSLPGSLVIWYDSVTIDGKLDWQDQLNNKNKPFFDISDGLFVNYTWKEGYPKSSAAVAGDRKFDVYMGIDVFGRNSFGGGQWTTNAALDVLKKDDVSAAIFAPGWVYETKQPPNFETAQNCWWSLVEKSWGIVQKYPRTLPFYSNFDQGRGCHLSIDGGQVSNAPWNNISSQGFQPFLVFNEDSSADSIQVNVDYKSPSYNGGGNITFKGSLEDKDYFTTRLYVGELVICDSPVHFTYSVQSVGTSQIGLSLEFSSSLNGKISVLLASGRTPLLPANQFSNKFSKIIMPHRVTKPENNSEWVLQESRITMEGYTLTEIHTICYNSTPEINKSLVGSHLKDEENTLNCSSKEYFAILGHISIKTSAQNMVFPPSTAWIVEGQNIKWTSLSEKSKTLSVKIIWKLGNGDASVFPKYNIFVVKLEKKEAGKATLSGKFEYLGMALVEAYYVSDLTVPSEISDIKFIIQVCGDDGTSQKIDDSPSLQLFEYL